MEPAFPISQLSERVCEKEPLKGDICNKPLARALTCR